MWYYLESAIHVGDTVDPKLWYKNNAGNWTELCDDIYINPPYGVSNNFRVVIHVTKNSTNVQKLVELQAGWYRLGSRSNYWFGIDSYTTNPNKTNCIYLEVAPNGTMTVVPR